MKKIHWLMAAVTIMTLNSGLVRADAFDDKSRAAAAQKEQTDESNAYAAQIREITSNNTLIVRRIPRGATITLCYNYSAAIWRNQPNGCRLANAEWNGIPVQICTEGYDQKLPPSIVGCHYHIARTGQDCAIFRNASIKPRCF